MDGVLSSSFIFAYNIVFNGIIYLGRFFMLCLKKVYLKQSILCVLTSAKFCKIQQLCVYYAHTQCFLMHTKNIFLNRINMYNRSKCININKYTNLILKMYKY